MIDTMPMCPKRQFTLKLEQKRIFSKMSWTMPRFKPSMSQLLSSQNMFVIVKTQKLSFVRYVKKKVNMLAAASGVPV
jgi:hypothetical protein